MEEVAVIGPGAIGLWLACRLSRAAPVQLIGRSAAWSRRARAGGLRLWSGSPPRLERPPEGRVRPTASPSGRPAAVFICVKSADTPAAARTARRLAGPQTPVVSLQNGLTHLAPTLRLLGRRRSVFGACYAAVHREGPAEARHHGGETIVLGRSPANAAAAREARRWLLAAGLEVPPPAREDRVLWTKAVFNAAANPIAALTAKPNGALAESPALTEILSRALAEASAAARAAGHPPMISADAKRVLAGCRAAPLQENSMLQDLRAGRPTEADAILAPVLAAARRHGRPAPVLSALYRFVKRLERELEAP